MRRAAVTILCTMIAMVAACAPISPPQGGGVEPGATPTPVSTPGKEATPTRDLGAALQPGPPRPDFVERDRAVVGPFAIQTWGLDVAQGVDSPQVMVATVSRDGQVLLELEEWNVNISPDTGRDLTGDGDPDAVLWTYSGGAHCCFSTHVYSLGAEITRIFVSQPSNCGGEFQDLDADEVAEFVTCDDSFAYAFCAYAGSPMPEVVLSYEPGAGFQPATASFSERYQDLIARHTEQAESAVGDKDLVTTYPDEVRCAVLAVVLDYLYTCQTDQAWSELERLYPLDDAAEFRSEIQDLLSGTELYSCPPPSP